MTYQNYKWKNRQEQDQVIRKAKIKYLGGKCSVCDSRLDLEFHHKNKDGKHSPSTWKEIKLGKIDILCFSCHRAIDGILYWKDKQVEYDKIIKYLRREIYCKVPIPLLM